jgi:hypothetical protein
LWPGAKSSVSTAEAAGVVDVSKAGRILLLLGAARKFDVHDWSDVALYRVYKLMAVMVRPLCPRKRR